MKDVHDVRCLANTIISHTETAKPMIAALQHKQLRLLPCSLATAGYVWQGNLLLRTSMQDWQLQQLDSGFNMDSCCSSFQLESYDVLD